MQDLAKQVTTLFQSQDLSKEERLLAAAIITELDTSENFSQELVDSLSNFFAACDKIPSEIRESLQERLDLEMKKERLTIKCQP